jgi:hypothetical protein
MGLCLYVVGNAKGIAFSLRMFLKLNSNKVEDSWGVSAHCPTKQRFSSALAACGITWTQGGVTHLSGRLTIEHVKV